MNKSQEIFNTYLIVILHKNYNDEGEHEYKPQHN